MREKNSNSLEVATKQKKDTKLYSPLLSTRSMWLVGEKKTAANWRSEKEVLFSKDNRH